VAINVGNQQAGQINNVEGTQHLSGGHQQFIAVSSAEARAAAQTLSAVLRDLRVSDGLRQDADALQRELAAAEPDRARVAGRLERMTGELRRLGALAGAGASLIAPLTTLGRWLGPAGAALLSLLT
jgi:hypothetical protein